MSTTLPRTETTVPWFKELVLESMLAHPMKVYSGAMKMIARNLERRGL
jgi:hypothetical protein